MRTLITVTLIAMAIPAQAFPVPKAARVRDITGTTWFGDGVVADTRYTFNADGSLTYAYNGATYHIGSWKQEGARVYWETNNKYCEFEGTLSGNMIAGNAWNIENFKKNLKFELVE